MSFRSWLKALQTIIGGKLPEPGRHRQGRKRKGSTIRLRLEELEDRLVPATISDGGTSTLSIVLATNENLTIASTGTSYTFSSNQVFTTKSGTDPANQNTAFSGLPFSPTLTSKGIAQYSTAINITDSGPGATVTFHGGSFANNFNVNLSNASAGDVFFNNNNSFGTVNLQAATTLTIQVSSPFNLSSSSGNITLQGNQQSTNSSGNPAVYVLGTVQCTGSGNVTVQGSNSTGKGQGVYVANTGSIIGGTTGNLSISGTGSDGVYIASGGGIVSSNGGNVQVTGQGVGASVQSFDGVVVAGQISAGGNGNVTVQGTGGNSIGSMNMGVDVSGKVTSGGGNVQVIGQGGGSASSQTNAGVSIEGMVTAGGTGTVTVQGIGGATTGARQLWRLFDRHHNLKRR